MVGVPILWGILDPPMPMVQIDLFVVFVKWIFTGRLTKYVKQQDKSSYPTFLHTQNIFVNNKSLSVS